MIKIHLCEHCVAGTPKQVQAVIESGIFQLLVNMARSKPTEDVWKESKDRLVLTMGSYLGIG